MKKSAGSVFLNILSVFTALILSIIFIVTAFALPLYYSVAGMLHPKTITKLIQHVDYVEVLRESEEVTQAMKEVGIDAGASNRIIQSDAVGGLLEDCADKLVHIFSQEEVDLSEFNAEFLQSLIDKHMDELLVMVEDTTGKTFQKEELKTSLHRILEDNTEAIDSMVADLEPIKEMTVTYSAATELVQGSLQWQIVLALALIEAALLGLIYVLRRKNYGGFVWLAVDAGIVGALLSLAALAVGSSLSGAIVAQVPDFMEGMLSAALGSIQSNLVIGLAVCFGVMVLAIVACAALRANGRRATQIAPPAPM